MTALFVSINEFVVASPADVHGLAEFALGDHVHEVVAAALFVEFVRGVGRGLHVLAGVLVGAVEGFKGFRCSTFEPVLVLAAVLGERDVDTLFRRYVVCCDAVPAGRLEDTADALLPVTLLELLEGTYDMKLAGTVT